MAGFALQSQPQICSVALFARERTVRRTLKRYWVDCPKMWVSWLMLNPSVADALKDDPTTKRLTHFSQSWGYDGWIAINIYPFIATNPEDMWHRAAWDKNGPDWYSRDDLMQNLADIEEVGRESFLRMVAFGAAPVERDQAWLEQCLEHYQRPRSNPLDDERLYCLGTTAQGQPLHPMARGKWRVPDSAKPVVWRRRG